MAFARLGLALLVCLGMSDGRSIAAPNADWSASVRLQALTSAEADLDHYIFADKVPKLRAALEAHRSELLALDDPKAFASKLTEELQSASGDDHFLVSYSQTADTNVHHTETAAEARERAAFFDYVDNGYAMTARLTGNVGYLSLRGFGDYQAAKHSIDAAMALLAHTDALIVDLRENHGGDSDTVKYLLAYFFPERIEVLKATTRTVHGTIVNHDVTPLFVGGPKYLKRAVYVVVGSKTISGGEEFAYTMQSIGRGIVVGARTVGAATGLGSPTYFLTEHLRIAVPDTMLQSPRTGKNWEGGVAPDILTRDNDALLVAYTHALASIHSSYDPLGELAAARRDPLRALQETFAMH